MISDEAETSETACLTRDRLLERLRSSRTFARAWKALAKHKRNKYREILGEAGRRQLAAVHIENARLREVVEKAEEWYRAEVSPSDVHELASGWRFKAREAFVSALAAIRKKGLAT